MEKKWLAGSIKSLDAETRTFRAIAYSFQVDRDGETITPAAFSNGLGNFQANPVLLWAHDYSKPPIGKVIGLDITTQGLEFEAQFADHDDARKIADLYAGGFLNAFSIGYISRAYSDTPILPGQRGRTFTDVELLEISAVPVPANPGALITARSKGLDTSMCEAVEQDAEPDVKSVVVEPAITESKIIHADEPEKFIKTLSAETLNRCDQLAAFLKEGRVLSSGNRKLIVECVDQMQAAIQALENLIDTTDPEKAYQELKTMLDGIESAINERESISNRISSLIQQGSETSTGLPRNGAHSKTQGGSNEYRFQRPRNS